MLQTNVTFHAHKWKHVTEFIFHLSLYFTHTNGNMLQNLYSIFRYISRTQMKTCFLFRFFLKIQTLITLYCGMERKEIKPLHISCFRNKSAFQQQLSMVKFKDSQVLGMMNNCYGYVVSIVRTLYYLYT